ncbi:hypothetical protein ACA910_017446 [Epithemia clementina (nom. ined.)]
MSPAVSFSTALRSSLQPPTSQHFCHSSIMPVPAYMTSKPKPPLSAYNLYFQMERKRILDGTDSLRLPITVQDIKQVREEHSKKRGKRLHRKTHGKIGFRDLARTVANRWKNLDESTRNLLDQQALEERNEHDKLNQEWSRMQSMGTSSQQPSRSQVFGLIPLDALSAARPFPTEWHPSNNVLQRNEVQGLVALQNLHSQIMAQIGALSSIIHDRRSKQEHSATSTGTTLPVFSLPPSLPRSQQNNASFSSRAGISSQFNDTTETFCKAENDFFANEMAISSCSCAPTPLEEMVVSAPMISSPVYDQAYDQRGENKQSARILAESQSITPFDWLVSEENSFSSPSSSAAPSRSSPTFSYSTSSAAPASSTRGSEMMNGSITIAGNSDSQEILEDLPISAGAEGVHHGLVVHHHPFTFPPSDCVPMHPDLMESLFNDDDEEEGV